MTLLHATNLPAQALWSQIHWLEISMILMRVILIKVGEKHKIRSIYFKYKPLSSLKKPTLGNYSAFYHLFTYILQIIPCHPFNSHYL